MKVMPKKKKLALFAQATWPPCQVVQTKNYFEEFLTQHIG